MKNKNRARILAGLIVASMIASTLSITAFAGESISKNESEDVEPVTEVATEVPTEPASEPAGAVPEVKEPVTEAAPTAAPKPAAAPATPVVLKTEPVADKPVDKPVTNPSATPAPETTKPAVNENKADESKEKTKEPEKKEDKEEDKDKVIEAKASDMNPVFVAALSNVIKQGKPVNLFDLKAPEGTKFPAKIKFGADVHEGQNILLYHYLEEKADWETIEPDDVDDGCIEATFDSLSPVAVVDVAEGSVPEQQNKTEEVDTETVSENESDSFTIQYKVADGQEEWGSVSISENKITAGVLIDGSEAKANDGYKFIAWKDEDGNEVTTEAKIVPVIDEIKDVTYVAEFEETEKLIDREISIQVGNQKVTAKGLMPAGASIVALKVATLEGYDEKIDESDETIKKIKIHDAFDIKILTEDGHIWQPVEHNSVVDITIENVTIENNKEDIVAVHRISDDNSTIDQLDAAVEGNSVEFKTDHFTVFVIDSVDYDTDSADSEWDISAAQDGSIMAYWYESSGKLIINGTGEIKDYQTPNSSLSSELSPIYTSLRNTSFEVVMSDGITKIGDYLFTECSGMTVTRLSGDLTSIGGCAFQLCSNLVLTELPSGITTIEEGAFEGTKIALTSLPSGITEIEWHTFENCNDLALTALPSGLTTIGDYAFRNTGLAISELPSGLTSIGARTFQGCTNITTISGGAGLTSIGTKAFFVSASTPVNTTLITSNPVLTNYDWEGSNRIISGATSSWDISSSGDGSLMAYWMEDSHKLLIQGDGTTTKAYTVANSFGGQSNASGAKVPSGGYPAVQVYDESASGVLTGGSPIYENLRNEEFHVEWDAPNLSSIGDGLFFQCKQMTSDELPQTITQIGKGSFYDCEALSISGVPNSLMGLGPGAFYNCKNITVSDLGTRLGFINDYAFAGCEKMALTSLPDTVTSIGETAFKCCDALALTSLPSRVTSIGAESFYGCPELTISALPSGVTEVGDFAFSGDKKIRIEVLPASLQTIGMYGFSDCQAMQKISGGEGITTIRNGAFWVGTPFSYTNKLNTVLTSTNTVLTSYNWTNSNRRLVNTIDGTYSITLPANIEMTKLDGDIVTDKYEGTGYVWEVQQGTEWDESDAVVVIPTDTVTDTTLSKMKGNAAALTSIAAGTGSLTDGDAENITVDVYTGTAGATPLDTTTYGAIRVRKAGVTCNAMETNLDASGKATGRICVRSQTGIDPNKSYTGNISISWRKVTI